MTMATPQRLKELFGAKRLPLILELDSWFAQAATQSADEALIAAAGERLLALKPKEMNLLTKAELSGFLAFSLIHKEAMTIWMDAHPAPIKPPRSPIIAPADAPVVATTLPTGGCCCSGDQCVIPTETGE